MADLENGEAILVDEVPEQPATQSLKPIFGFDTIEEFTNNGLKQIVKTTKAVNELPVHGTSRDLYSAHAAFKHVMDTESDRVLQLAHQLIQLQNIKGNIARREKEEKMDLLQEYNDLMLERININLDEMAGYKKQAAPIIVQAELKEAGVRRGIVNGSWNQKTTSEEMLEKLQSAKLLTAKNIIRPQANFRVPVDNTAHNPFVPRLTEKPHSIKPLAILPEYGEDGQIESYLHPYECELDKFEPPKCQLQRREPLQPRPLDTTELVYISEPAQLQRLLIELEPYNELAVDLEHHSYRTYQGITCLMQLSTRDKDYIIDTLTLREELHTLNLVLADPKKLKVFHGADSDIDWLQRDLSLYVVNMFDTHRAARKLEFARYSLAFLLKHYCNIEADKTFQLADWRIRPLPQKLIDYARQDTHYLLYVYDRLRNELIDRSAGQTHVVRSVYTESTLLCKKRYVKPAAVNDTSHMVMYYKSKRSFDNRQLWALKELYGWRDKIARQEDESAGYVLPQHMLLQIAESLPREMQGILACCNPIPPLVRQHLQVLHYIVLKAREQPLVKPIAVGEVEFRPQSGAVGRDLDNPLYCPHDLSHMSHEGRQDLPTLLGNNLAPVDVSVELAMPKLSVFVTPENSDNEEEAAPKKATPVVFITPYQRYISVLPFAEEEKRRELARQAAVNRQKVLCPERVDPPPVQPKVEPSEEEKEYALPLREIKKRQREEEVAENDRIRRANLQAAVMESVAKKFKTNESETARKRKRSESKSEDDDEPVEVEPAKAEVIEVQSDNEEPPAPTTTSDTPGTSSSKKKWSHKKQKPRKSSDFRQSSNKPIPFDYSKVDFSRFQGGSSQQNQAKNPAGFMGFKKQKEQTPGSKGGPKRFNQMNKNMFSFAGFQGKKKK